MKKVLIVISIIALLGIGFIGLGAFGLVSWGVSSTVEVAKQEFAPKELLRKYEWFKDAAASLDKKQADISVYQSRLEALKEGYGDTPYAKWDRTDKEAMQQWRSEVAGVTASFNQLASEYNANMAKFNWRFTEAGRLPEGATDPLPREYKPYK